VAIRGGFLARGFHKEANIGFSSLARVAVLWRKRETALTKKKNGGLRGLLTAAVASAVFGMWWQPAHAASVVAWGYNMDGQIGDGTGGPGASRKVPVTATGLTSGVTIVAAGGYHSLAVKDGGVWVWGYNSSGQLGDGTAVGQWIPEPLTGLASGVSAIAGGGLHSLAVKDGGVWAWGDNQYGQLGNSTGGRQLSPAAVSNLSGGVTAIAAGWYHSLAIKDGGVWAWGFNTEGQLGDGTTISRSTPASVGGLGGNVIAIACGVEHSLAVKDSALYIWGSNYYGELGDGTTSARSTAGTLAGLTSGVTSIAGGAYYSLAVKDGGVWAWGRNDQGQLGDGTKTDSLVPKRIDPTDLYNITSVAAGEYTSYALSADGTIWVWGNNDDGELGLGDRISRLTPSHLLPPSGQRFTSIAGDMNSHHVVATLEPVPEPRTLTLLIVGTVALASWVLRRRWLGGHTSGCWLPTECVDVTRYVG
jgi:hypothetical protein